MIGEVAIVFMSSSRADLELITTTLRDLKRLVSGNEGGPSKKVKLSPAVWDNGEKISWAPFCNSKLMPMAVIKDEIRGLWRRGR